MNYTKKDILSLIDHLKIYPGPDGKEFKYEVLMDFFETKCEDGTFDIEGLTDPPKTVSSARVVKDLQEQFPDAWYALSMPDEEVLLYIGNVHVQEHPIACWRLYRQNVV
jgi:hypothetical protein